jgi:AraC family transcriptional regulator of arabinose operon
LNSNDIWEDAVINNSAYYNQCDDDIPNDSFELFVKSCGHYKLLQLPKLVTYRPQGRRDYQLIYVADGIVHFIQEQTRYQVGKGGIFIFEPNVIQNYYYNLDEKPDVYWIHFTGREVVQLLQKLGLVTGQPLQLQGKVELRELFERIIVELRFERFQFVEMAQAYLKQLLITAARHYNMDNVEKQAYHSLFDEVIEQFHHEYQTDINIAEYAQRYHISCSWFIREFKKYTGYSPKQYITNLRIRHAKELLNNHYLSISNVSMLVGYDNQLYFSRIFHKYTGMSPSEYRDRTNEDRNG